MVWLPCGFLAHGLHTTFFFDLWPRAGTEAVGGIGREGVHMAETRRVESSNENGNSTEGAVK